MITKEQLLSYGREDLADLSQRLDANDVKELVSFLNEKADAMRYQALLLLEERCETHNDVYAYMDEFASKLDDSNSYQRNIGARMLSANAKWDAGAKFDAIVDKYLSLCDDEKPVTVRQCVQGLMKVALYRKGLQGK
jgi:hypothetical protein